MVLQSPSNTREAQQITALSINYRVNGTRDSFHQFINLEKVATILPPL